MNRVYKKVWNRLRGCYVAVSEALGSGQSRGKAAIVVIGAAAAAALSPAFAGSYTDQTFTGDGEDQYGLLKPHGTHHDLHGTTTFIGKNGGMGALITSDAGEIRNHGTVYAYGYGSDQDDTTSWGIRSTWGVFTNDAGATEYLFGYGGSGKNSMGVGLQIADYHNYGAHTAHVVAEGGSGNTSWGVGVSFNREQSIPQGTSYDMKVKGGTGEYANGVGMHNGWSLSGISLLANNSTPIIKNAGTITGTIEGGKAYGALGIALLSEQRWTNNGNISLTLTGGSVNGAAAYGIYQRGSSSFTNNGTLTFTSAGQNSGKARPWNAWDITNAGTLKLIGQFGNSIYWANLKQKSGTTETSLSNFGNYTTQVEKYAQSLKAIGSTGVVDTSSFAFAHGEGQTVTSFDAFASLSGMTGGAIYITDKTFSASGQNAIRNYLKAAGVSSDVSINFAGTASFDNTAGAPVYSVANTNKFLDESGHLGLTLNQISLESEIEDLVVGNIDGIKDSIGFKGVTGVTNLTVAEGYSFNLLGDGSLAADFDTVVDGTLKLGNKYDTATNGGTLKSIQIGDAGTLIVERGSFSTSNITGNGGIQIDRNAGLSMNDLVIGTASSNEGSLTIGGSLTFNDGASFTQSDGTLTTNLDNVFQNVTPSVVDPLNVISLNSQAPEEIRAVASELFRKYVPGEVADELAAHATFTGGEVVVTGVNLTETQRDDLTNAFKEQFGSSTSIRFEGNIAGVSKDDILNTAKVNELHDAGVLTDVIYLDRKLEGENQAVEVGANGITDSVGFAGIKDATSITVKDGKKLVLVGEAGNAAFEIAGVNTTVTGAGSTLALGSLGLQKSADWQGTLKGVTVENGGALDVVAGKYTLDGDLSIQDGALTNKGELTVDALTGSNVQLTNDNTLTAKNGAQISGVVTNNGTLNVTGDMTFNSDSSNFTNNGSAIIAGDMTLSGTLTNGAQGVIETNTMAITGQLNNSGRIEASDDSTLDGILRNTGTINLFDKDMTVGSAGRLDNSGITHSITGVSTIIVNGYLSNVDNADFEGTNFEVSQSTAQVENSANLMFETVSVTDGAQFTNSGTVATNAKTRAGDSTTDITVDSNGVYFNSGLTDADTITIGTGEMYNTGELIADEMIVQSGGYFINGRAPVTTQTLDRATPRGTTIQRKLTINEGGKYTNTGDAFYAEGTINGEYTNTADGVVNAGISDWFVDGTGITIGTTGVIKNAGTWTMGGAMTNNGTIMGDGTLVLQHEGAGTNQFVNTGAIDVGSLEADNITFTQEDGTLKSGSGWFSNSTVNVVKGEMSHAEVGKGNTYTVGDAVADQVTATLTFETLTSDSTVVVAKGGQLNAETIALDGVTKDSVKLDGGRISTTLDQIFDGVVHKALDIDATTPDDLVDYEGVNVTTGVGEIKAAVSTGINFGWGTMAFDDGVYSATLAADVLKKLDADDVDPVDHEGQLEVAFNGKSSQVFDVTLANQVRAKDDEGATAYATFSGETLVNTVSNGQSYDKLYVGRADGATDANVLDNNIGFKQVTGATGGMTVADGHHFVLTGELQSAGNPDYEMLDGDLTVTGAGSMMTLGSYGTVEKTEGRIHNVTLAEGGTLRARHGDFTGETLVNKGGALYVGGDGKTTVNGSLLLEDTDATLTFNGYTAEAGSNAFVFGTLAVTTLTGTGGEMTNAGTLEVDSANISGMTVTNKGDAAFEELTLSAGTVETTEDGTTTVAKTTTVNGGTLENAGTFTSDALVMTGGKFENAGTATMLGAQSATTLAGTLENAGTLKIEGTHETVLNNGAMVHNTGTMTIAPKLTIEGGELHQSSDTTLAATDVVVSDGLLRVDAEKTVKGESLTLSSTEKSHEAVLNDGLLDFADITVTQGALAGTGTLGTSDSTITVNANGSVEQAKIEAQALQNQGSVTTNALNAAQATNAGAMTITGTQSGTLANSGELKLEGAAVEGDVTNTGTLTGTGNVTLAGGKLTHSSDVEATFETFTTDAGTLIVDEGKTMTGDAFVMNGGEAGINGTLAFADMTVNGGKLKGQGTIGSSASKVTVNTDGTIEDIKHLEANTLLNEGTISAQNVTVTTGTNAGDLTIEGGLLKGDLTNTGTMTLDGATLASGTLQNAGTLTGGQTVTIAGGKLHQSSDLAAQFNNLTITAGGLTVDEGKAVEGTGTLTVNGEGDLIDNDGTIHFADATITKGTVSGNGTFGPESSTITVDAAGALHQGTILSDTLLNKGEVIAQDALKVVGTLTNSGTLTTNGTADIAGLVNAGTANFNQGVNFTGSNTSSGTLNVSGKDLNVAQGGSLTLTGGTTTLNAGATLDGTLANKGGVLNADHIALNASGLLSTNSTTNVDKLSGTSGSIELSGGALHIKDLTDATGMDFTMTGGSIVADKGWFENSTLNFEGGKFDASGIKDDAGGASGMLGHNTVNIGREDLSAVIGPDNELASGEKVNWKDPYVVVTVEKVTSDTIINIHSGGVLDVSNLELTPETGAGQTITVGKGGGIQTSLDQIFDKVSTSVIDIEAVDAETGTVDIITDVLATTTVGGVKDSIANGLGFEDGSMIAFDDPDWSLDLVTSVSNSLTQAGLIGEDTRVEQHYLGDFMGDFTIDTASRLEEEQDKLGNSHVLDPGVVFDQTTLHNNTLADGDANRGLVIGGTAAEGENQINFSTGFKNVANADSVRIEGDKEFVLVGTARPDDFNWETDYDDGNKLLVDAADGGHADVNEGTLTLGSNGLAHATAGWLNSAQLGDKGELVTKNGEFAVWEIDAGAGRIDVTEGSILHTNSLETNGSQIHVGGGLTVGEDMTLKGDIVVDDKGSALYKDVTIASGSMVNHGTEEGLDLVVSAGAEHENFGTSIWNNVTIDGTGTNGAAIPDDGITGDMEAFTSDAILQIGSKDDPNNAFNMNGSFTNNGKLNASEVEQTTVAGDLLNKGQALYDDMTVLKDGASVNQGLEQGDILVVEGEHTNTGTSIWNQFEVNGSGTNGTALPEDALVGWEEGFKSDTILQIGSKDNPDNAFDVNGSFVNNGMLNAENVEVTTVNGSLANNGKAWYDDMTVGETGSSVNVGYEQGDILTVEGTHDNTGVSIWNEVVINGSGTNGATLPEGAPVGWEEGFKSDAILQIGTAQKPENAFNVNGSYVNNGILQAENVETTTVAGDLANNGQALYDDMTVGDKGSSLNVGYEQGDILTVEGTHENTGVSIWNEVVINGSGSNGAALPEDAPLGHEEGFKSDAILQIGTAEKPDDAFDVNGSYVNNGILNAENVETTTVAGNLANNGQALYDDMTIVAGGTSDNKGYEKGDILTVGGNHSNSGVSIWNEVIVDAGGNGLNDKGSTLVIGDDKDGGDLDDHFKIDGGFVNDGTLDATKTEDTIVNGALDNNGHAEYDDMDVNQGGSSTNDNYEKGDILDVNAGGKWENNGESHWNNVNNSGDMTNNGSLTTDEIVMNGGTLDNTGKIDTSDLIVNDGLVDLGHGSMDADSTEINGGDLIVGNHEPLDADNRVDFDTVLDKPVNGHIWVIGNGDIAFGMDADQFADKIGAPDIPATPSRITVTEKVTIGETGSLAVGPSVWNDEADHKDVGDGNLYFADGSLTVVDISKFGHDAPVFEGTKPGATVTIEDGAKLHFGNLVETGEDVYATNDDGSGLDWIFSVKWDDQKVWINAALEDIRNKYPDIVIPENVNDQLSACQNAGSPDQILTCTVIKNKDLTNEEKTRILNSIAQIGFASGAMASAFNDANTTADALENRLSLASDAYDANAVMREADRGHTLWVDVLGGSQKADGYKVSGNMETGFDADTFGFIMGADHKLDGRNVIVGGAFSYLDGSLDSTGDLLETKSDNSSFGLHAYGAWKPTDKVNLVGTFSFLHHNVEASMGLPIAYQKATADIDTDLLSLGVRGEYHFALGERVRIIPHAGLRMVYGLGGSFDTDFDGQKAYENDADATITFQMPIGVAARADFNAGKGWNIVPQADLTIIPQFGDTSQSVDVSGVSTSAVDTVEGDFAGHFVGQVNLGIQAMHANGFSLGARYGLNAGSAGKQDHAFKLEIRKMF